MGFKIQVWVFASNRNFQWKRKGVFMQEGWTQVGLEKQKEFSVAERLPPMKTRDYELPVTPRWDFISNTGVKMGRSH